MRGPEDDDEVEPHDEDIPEGDDDVEEDDVELEEDDLEEGDFFGDDPDEDEAEALTDE